MRVAYQLLPPLQLGKFDKPSNHRNSWPVCPVRKRRRLTIVLLAINAMTQRKFGCCQNRQFRPLSLYPPRRRRGRGTAKRWRGASRASPPSVGGGGGGGPPPPPPPPPGAPPGGPPRVGQGAPLPPHLPPRIRAGEERQRQSCSGPRNRRAHHGIRPLIVVPRAGAQNPRQAFAALWNNAAPPAAGCCAAKSSGLRRT
jgi:hypothetical protein